MYIHIIHAWAPDHKDCSLETSHCLAPALGDGDGSGIATGRHNEALKESHESHK